MNASPANSVIRMAIANGDTLDGASPAGTSMKPPVLASVEASNSGSSAATGRAKQAAIHGAPTPTHRGRSAATNNARDTAGEASCAFTAPSLRGRPRNAMPYSFTMAASASALANASPAPANGASRRNSPAPAE